jgi:hypothetical protein
MNTKILPVTYPTMTTFTGYANALAILQSHEDALGWVYSQYLQIYVVKNEIEDINKEYAPIAGYMPGFFGDFDNRRLSSISGDIVFKGGEDYPFLKRFEIPLNMISLYEPSYARFIKHCIDNDLYVYTYVNTLHIGKYGRNAETTSFNGHPVFIYGYNDDASTFSIADFFKNDKYSFAECTYDEMEAALKSESTDFLSLDESVKYFIAIQYKNSDTFHFSMDYVRETVKAYIDPDPKQTEKFTRHVELMYQHLNWKMSAIIGVNIYRFLSDFAKMYLALREYGVTGIDIRPFHALYDHKVMMCERLNYFLKRNYLSAEKRESISDYEAVRNKAEIARGLILKYNTNLKDSALRRLDPLLDEMKSAEIGLLKTIFDV